MSSTESSVHAGSGVLPVELSASELKYRLVADDFATPEECREIMALTDKYGTVGGGYGDKAGQSNSENEVYVGYFLNESETGEKFRKEHEAVLRVIERARKLLKRHFGLPFLWLDHGELISREPLEPDSGTEPEVLSQQWHMDNNGPQIWRRTHTGILYLNDGFEGGYTCMKDDEEVPYREMQPVAGRLIGFDATRTPHAVTKLRSGKRYVLNMWFSSHMTNVRRQIKVFHPGIANALNALKRGGDV